MKITKSQLKKIIKEELMKEAGAGGYERTKGFNQEAAVKQIAVRLGGVLAGDASTAMAVAQALEDKYPSAAAAFNDAYDATYTATEDDLKDWEPESEYIERWAREQGIPEDEF